jgi:hypothetical protein
MRGADRVRNTARLNGARGKRVYVRVSTRLRPSPCNKLKRFAGGAGDAYFRPSVAQATLYLGVQMSPTE